MPIQIRELIIRATIESPQPTEPAKKPVPIEWEKITELVTEQIRKSRQNTHER
ncbi:MAG: DUF5908 family protein [Spirosomataceae bacterium]